MNPAPPAPQPDVEIPAGFHAAGSDIAYRPMTTDEFDCTPDQLTGCFGILVFSAAGCPTGADVTVGIFDKAADPDTPIGTVDRNRPRRSPRPTARPR